MSNVIRGRGRLGEATRARVERAILDLQYEPHPGASSMRSRRSRQIAHLLPTRELAPGNVTALEFIRSLVTAAARHDYYVILGQATGGSEQIATMMRSGRVDAFIFSAIGPDDARIRTVAERSFPFASFGRTAVEMPQCWVDVDNARGAEDATAYLLARGHRRICYLAQDSDDYWDVERISGYSRVMGISGLAPRLIRIPGASNAPDARMDALLTEADRPSAVIANGDLVSAAVYRSALRLGLGIGTDLAVLGFEGGLVGRSLTPSLTAVTIPVAQIADLVTTRALREIDSPTDQPGQTVRLVLTEGRSA